MGLFVSPIAFATTRSARALARCCIRSIRWCGIIDGFRWSHSWRAASSSTSWRSRSSDGDDGVLLVIGIWYFRRMERGFRRRDLIDERRSSSASDLGKRYQLRHQTRASRTSRCATSIARRCSAPFRQRDARQRRRARTSGRCATCRSTSAPARWSASSAATAPARARCSRSSAASPSRPKGG